MSLSRRNLLQTGATVAASAVASQLLSACGQAGPGLAIPAGKGLPIESFAVYRQAIGSSFQVLGPQRVSLRLLAVDDLSTPASRASAQGEVFSMTFVGPAGGPDRQASLDLSHSRLGQGTLFVVPSGTREDGSWLYQAVINHQLPL